LPLSWPQRVAVPKNALAELPEKVTFSQAATFPVAGLTALLALGKGGPLLGKRELDGEIPDASGRARDQHALAEERTALAEGQQRRQPGHRKRRRLRERDLLGKLGQRVLRHGYALSPRTFGQEADDTLADLRAGAVGRGAPDAGGRGSGRRSVRLGRAAPSTTSRAWASGWRISTRATIPTGG